MKKLIFTTLLFFLAHNIFSQTSYLLWAKQLGGDFGRSVAVDADGNVYTTGHFSGPADFDPGPETYFMTAASRDYNDYFPIDIFISKLDAAGNFLWAKQFAGVVGGVVFANTGIAIAVDANGNVYTAGAFAGQEDFDPGPEIFNITSHSFSGDIFVLKLDASGNFLWAKQLGGISSDIAYSISVDTIGNVYTTGDFGSTGDFDPGPGIYNMTSAGSQDIFVSKLDASGNFLWAKQLGGENDDGGNSIAVDVKGNVYTTGYFFETADFDPGPGTYYMTDSSGDYHPIDIFISKLDASGNFLWARQLGGHVGYSLAVDANGNVYTTGNFVGTADFDPGPASYNMTSFNINSSVSF